MPPPPRPSVERGAAHPWALPAILAGAAVLRGMDLSAHSLWSDEVFAVWLSRAPWRALCHLIATADFHPPLYYLFMKAWIGVAGTGEAALRAPSAAFSVSAVWLAYALVRRVASEGVALLTAVLVAASPFAIMAGQEARMYPLLAVLALATTLLLITAVERGGPGRWTLYAAAAAALFYTMYVGALVIAAHGIWVLGWERRQLRSWCLAVASAVVLFLPWLPALSTQLAAHSVYTNAAVQEGRPEPSIPAAALQVVDVLGLLAFGGSLFGTAGYLAAPTSAPVDRAVATLPFAATVVCGVWGLWRRPRALALLLLPSLMTVGILAAAAAAAPVFSVRWFSFLVPFWAALLAQGVVSGVAQLRTHRRLALIAWAAGLLAYPLPVLYALYFEPATWPFRWRDAAAYVERRVSPGDVFLYGDWPARETLGYYLPRRYPSLELSSPVAAPGGGLTAERARLLAARHARAWLVLNGPGTPLLRERTLPALAAAFRVAEAHDFGGAHLYLLTARRGARR